MIKKNERKKALGHILYLPSSNFLENLKSNFFSKLRENWNMTLAVKSLNSYIKFGWVASVNRWVGTYPNYFSRNCAPRSQGAEVS